MGVGIGFVLELPNLKPAVFFGEFGGLVDHAGALQVCWRNHDLCPEKTHHLASLDAETLGHRNDQWIALLRTNHREANPSIAAGRFDDGLAGFESPVLFGVLNDAKRESIFNRSHRVERLDLHIHVDVVGAELVEPHDRRIADRPEYVVVQNIHISRNSS